jgi:hypothetical protein
VFRNQPLVARLLPRLLYQLVPAALVTTVGVLLLSNLARVSDTPPVPAAVETAINAEAVFKIMPREPVEEAPAEAKADAKRLAAARAAANPKPPVAGTVTPTSRKAVNEAAAPRQVAGVVAPLPIVQIPEQPIAQVPEQPAAAAPDSDNTVMGKLRSASTAVQRIPQWATRSVAGWFSADTPPPRPPAPVPAQNFQAGT